MSSLRWPLLVLVSSLVAPGVRATPSTAFWSPATTSVQAFLVPHVTYDTYFAEAAAYAIDAGLTMGLLPFEALQAEIGLDVNYPGDTRNGLLLNAKLAVPDGAFGAWWPGLSAGIYAVGFREDVSTYDVLHAEVGKTFFFGNLTAGGYWGLDRELMVDEDGGRQQAGFLASYTSPEWVFGRRGLEKMVLVADVQTGRSAFGAAGGGLVLYFTSRVALLAGPVFFLNPEVQPGKARWMGSLQLDVDLDLGKPD